MYDITDDINKATYWIPTADDNHELGRVTLGKAYKLIKSSEYYDEIVIIDNFDTNIPLWITHRGYFITNKNIKLEDLA